MDCLVSNSESQNAQAHHRNKLTGCSSIGISSNASTQTLCPGHCVEAYYHHMITYSLAVSDLSSNQTELLSLTGWIRRRAFNMP